jgi:hypothetical protein
MAFTDEDDEMPTGGRPYIISVGTSADGKVFGVRVEFDGFTSRAEAERYVDMLRENDIFGEPAVTH